MTPDEADRVQAVAGFYRYLYEGLPLGDLNIWLSESSFLEELLGKTEFLDLLSSNVESTSEGRFRANLRNLVERTFPGGLVTLRAKRICQAMLDGSMDVLAGVRAMSALYHQPGGESVVAQTWVGLDSETDSFPTPDKYPLWEAIALRAQLNELERYKATILEAAKEHLKR